MINLTPIAKPIQERLKEKMRVLGRTKTKAGKISFSAKNKKQIADIINAKLNPTKPFIEK